jgi:formyltetrahydrofolate-dependent phosphoribosylglycinamide formyltransferase
MQTIQELQAQLANGSTTAEKLAQASLEKIESTKNLNAYISVLNDRALERAKESDKRRAEGKSLGALDGIPVAVKDNMCLTGTRTTAASKILDNFVAPYTATALEKLEAAGVTLVVLAGFMRILTPYFVGHFAGRIMNIHPALLPSFPGAHAHRDVLAYGVKVSGCTVHFVDEGTDSGPIIMQAAVPVLDDDTEETLGARVLKEEHRIYPECIRLYCEGKLKVEGRKVTILA